MTTNVTIKPTVGRVVLFHPDQNVSGEGFAHHPDDQPYAAMVSRVWNDGMVNLVVFDAIGVSHSRTSVRLVQDGEAVPTSGNYCEWMPYQKVQASKDAVDGRMDAAKLALGKGARRMADSWKAINTATSAPSEKQPESMRNEVALDMLRAAAPFIASNPHSAESIAAGITTAIGKLFPVQGLDKTHAGMPTEGWHIAHPVVAPVPLSQHAVARKANASALDVTLPVVNPGPDSLEREIQAKASVAPRVTPADIEAEIAAEYSTTLDKAFAGCPLVEGMDRVTVAVVVLKNGAKLVGVNYGAIDPANHSSEIGTEQARAAAIEQAWPLLGFRLRDKLARAE